MNFALLALAAVAIYKPGEIEIVDGDTLRLPGEVLRVVSIDAPETEHRAECVAERYLGELAKRKAAEIIGAVDEITIGIEPSRDRYGRLLGSVLVDDESFADLMIDARVAVYWSGRRHDWCAESE